MRTAGLTAASRIEEEEERSRRRSTESSGKERNSQPSFSAASGGHRSTPTGAKIALPARMRAAGLAVTSRIEEKEARSRRLSTETSDTEKNSQPSLSASPRSRRTTPAAAKTIIKLLANVRAAGLAAAFKIEEEEERSRKRSTETSANEALHDKTGSNPNTPNSTHHTTIEEADVPTAESRRHSGKTGDRMEDEDLSEKKQDGHFVMTFAGSQLATDVAWTNSIMTFDHNLLCTLFIVIKVL